MSYEREYKITGGIPDIYNSFKKEKLLSGEKVVDKKTFVDICHTFNKKVSDKIIRESFEFKLPFGLGYIRIKANRLKYIIEDGKLLSYKSCPDWNKTRKFWKEKYKDLSWEEIKQIPNKKIIVHTNEHSDGMVMKWYWDKRFCNVKNQTAYKFKPVKGVQDKEYYKDDDSKFYGRLGLANWIKDSRKTNEYYR